MHWLIDFDDTLAIGPTTWALSHVFPKMIRDNHLPYDADRFADAVIYGQRQGNQDVSDDVVIDDLFRTMNWPDTLKASLIEQIYKGYQPALFDDARPLLERLAAKSQTIYIVSNNNYAVQIAEQLGIAHYFAGMYTPKTCGGLRAKPQRDMWDYLLSHHEIESGQPVAIVGDDPWSDGAFADECNINCWIVDRMKRFDRLHVEHNYHWVSSLAEIEIA
ncbi:MAG: HAD family hydrolase [Chloroflexota bacterium]